MYRFRKYLLALMLAPMLALPASAQTASRVSLQVSALGSVPFSGGLSAVNLGPGFEIQVRFNPSAFSIGGGFEISWHEIEDSERQVRLSGAFVEPRYVLDVGSETFAPYLAGRIAISQTRFKISRLSDTATGFTVNVGGGILFVLSPKVNLDVGASIGAKDLGSATVATDPPTVFDLGSGSNVILRVGLAFGLGG